MDQNDELLEMLSKHNYAGIFQLLRDTPAVARQMTVPQWHTLGYAYLSAGDLPDALVAFEEAQRLQCHLIEGSGGAYADQISAILFMLKRPLEAITLLRATIGGLKTKSIWYADGAGGVSHGLLLWFVAGQTGSNDDVQFAKRWLINRVKRKAIANWPGPLAEHLLKKRDMGLLLGAEFGASGLADVANKATSDFYTRQRAIKLYFYLATLASEHQLAVSKVLLQACASMENTHSEPEWYLARQAIGAGFTWDGSPSILH